jgi:septum formation protein
MQKELILASASARRRQILDALGVPFRCVTPSVNEVFHADDPRRTARENALQKNAWCRERFGQAWILSADTVIDFAGACISKPHSLEQARCFLRMFAGRTQTVITAAALSGPDCPAEIRMTESRVTFRHLSDEQIDAYFARVDPLDKAGAYNIDQHGDMIIDALSGSHSNVMGLPRRVVAAWLQQHGIPCS